MQVTQLINEKGNAVKNQFVITTDIGTYFKSYDSVVAFVANGYDKTPIFSKHWDYSNTTVKHLKTFLGSSLTKRQLQDRCNCGGIFVDSCNSLEII